MSRVGKSVNPIHAAGGNFSASLHSQCAQTRAIIAQVAEMGATRGMDPNGALDLDRGTRMTDGDQPEADTTAIFRARIRQTIADARGKNPMDDTTTTEPMEDR